MKRSLTAALALGSLCASPALWAAACGIRQVADVTFDKKEHNVVLSMEQHIARVQGGWVAEYAYLVKVLKEGKEQVVDNRQGTISWLTGQHGNIVTASDKFTSMGKSGFTDTTYRYDAQLRLTKSVSRGTDALTNGESSWRWNPQGQVVSAQQRSLYLR